ncbi:MAG: hypothetical protein JWP81_3244 [Ferruginibacter sp.]|nr:hypothetical protein [Ferruginibacter sp.]
MKKSSKSYTIFQKASSIFLMLVLLWLTVSTPFILATQQEMAKQQKAISIDLPISGSDEDCPDSSGNNNIEEKAPVSGNSLSEEFLHEHHTTQEFGTKTPRNYKLENSGTYIAFHGELHAPPPNAA